MAKKKEKERSKKLRCNSIALSYFVVVFFNLSFIFLLISVIVVRFFPPRITLVEKLYLEIVCDIVTLLLLDDNVKLSATL